MRQRRGSDGGAGSETASLTGGGGGSAEGGECNSALRLRSLLAPPAMLPYTLIPRRILSYLDLVLRAVCPPATCR